jgi:hypothetical protein
MNRIFTWRALAGAGALFAASTCAWSADVTSVRVTSTSSSAQSNVPVTFGQVFKPGDVPANAVIGARNGSTTIPIQVDKKATHADGSLRHAVLSLVMPSMGANASQVVTLTNAGSVPPGGAITPASLLATGFDTTISLNIGGTVYSASARDFLSGSPAKWLSGPLATEFLLSGPVRTTSGTAHPHLQARFHVRAYQGLQSVRVEAVLENNWAFESGPRNYTYNLTVNVAGRGAVYTQNSVNHYRQSRWRRVVWWGTVPSFTVKHDNAYLMATRAVPSYDTRVQVTSGALSGWVSGLGSNPGVMSIGALEANMPSPGGRFEIAPLPAFQAAYLLSQDDRARRVTIGYGEQAGAWPMHYRDKATDQAPTLDANPNMTIIGGSGIFGNFPACGGSCDTNGLLPEASHHPSLVYLPYLLTGDYYLMEELVFWGNWVLFYGESSRHGGSQGLVVWDQVRGQAWALRTLAQSAYATPDAHPLKNYLEQKLQNNIDYFVDNWVDSNPLGYMTNTGAAAWLGFPGIFSTWMDDFMTWTMGHIVNLGFTQAAPVLAWKARFPVGRLTDANMCWTLASTNWVYATHRGYGGDSNSGTFVTNWTDWRRNVVYGWDESLRGTNSIGGQEAALFNAACASSQMTSILGIGQGNMIGWDGPDAYPANIQAAAAAAVEAGAPNAQQAFNRLTSRGGYPLNAYGDAPQWALWPATVTASLPAVQISANPTAVTSGQTSTLTWSATSATSCAASGGWAGNKALSGSQATAPITATTTYTLTCSNASGNRSAAATVTLQTQQAPTLTFSANPTSVSSGGSTQLRWSTTGATSCTASGSWSGSRPLASNGWTISGITSNRTFTLTCTGAGGNVQRSASVTVGGSPPAAPTLTFSANPTSVASGGSTQLRWSTTNATSCTASGSWSGSRPLASNGWTIAGITSNRTFTLTCTGAGGSVQRAATVTVQSGSAPTLTFSANPTSVASGGSTQLRWSSTHATSCTASGSWSGSRPVASNGWTIAGITSNRTFNLQCSGTGGSISRTVTVTVGGGGSTSLSGAVDSSYVDRFGTNKIYVFAGNVTPDDIDGAGAEPVTTLAVNQDANACTFGYAGGALTAGTYTIAFTQDAGADAAGRNDSLSFVGTRQVTVGASGVTSNFRPSGILTVGPGKQFATLRAAQLAATDGAVIEIDAGTYVDDVTVWRQNRVTIRGVGGGRAHIQGNRVIPFDGSDRNNGMGLMVIRGTGISVENIEFSGARVVDENGAGIRNQGRDLTICGGYHHDNEDGFLGEAIGTLLVEYSEFSFNGECPSGGCNHNLYIDGGDRLIFRHNYSHHAIIGHTLKTRAAENYILYNRLMDEQTGSSSYNIDVPNGGLTFVIGNLIQQGPMTDNSLMLNYGTEGLSGGRTHELYLVNNTWVNDMGSGNFVGVQGGTSLVRVINNLFVGPGSIPSGTVTTNLRTDSPGLMNEAGFDYRLTAASPAVNAGTAPGSAAGTALAPVYQYVHKAMRQGRPGDSRIDIGAYEFVP